MNKKLYTVLLISIITLLSISSASAWLFGDNEDVKTINFTGNETMVMYGTDTPAGENNEYPLSITKDKESYCMNLKIL